MNLNFKIVKFFALLLFLNCKSFNAYPQNKKADYSYNYSEIAPHPRLLLNKSQEVKVIGAVNNSKELKKVHDYIIETSNEFLTEPPVAYVMRGKRLLKVSRIALKRLYYLSYSYRVTNQKKYLDKVEQELQAICNFKDWNPSHFLDAGEMCMGVSIAYDWLYDHLNESTKQLVRNAIIEKALKPSYNEEYNWFLIRHNNWNSVCNSGLVFGALAILEDEKEVAIPIIERALETVLLPLEAYGPDGNYPEGPGYWNYGTTFQVMMFAALESALGSDNGLYKTKGFLESASYMMFSAGGSGSYFNYYDCGFEQTAKSSLFWFANKTNNTSLVYKELELINKGEYTKTVLSNIDRIVPNTIVFGKDLDVSKIKKPSKKLFIGHGITPVALVRTEWKGDNGKYFGIKGGSASDGHSHMDQGSFVYDIGNLRWSMDFGLQSYNTLESKGVDLWNLEQDAERWDVFRYNNFNHNTISINNQKHNVKGRAKIIESYEGDELGAKVDLTEVLNFNNELKSATRKATIVKEKKLKIVDEVETNTRNVNLRWNMVTPAKAEIINKNTIKLSQGAKNLLLKVESNVSFKLVLRPSENPSAYKAPFNNKLYGSYNHKNPGTVMVGFDSEIPKNTKAKFTVTMVEGKSDLILQSNTIILDAPNPSKASEGDKRYFDVTSIGVSSTGELYEIGTPDWNVYGRVDKAQTQDKSFRFRIDAKKISDKGIVSSGIDRSSDGHLGVRGGDGNGIDKNEGYILGLDLSEFDASTVFKLTKIGITFLDGSESCVIVNKKSLGKMITCTGKTRKSQEKEIIITKNLKRNFVDVTKLNAVLKGGANHTEFLSLFNTSESGSFRISGFEFQVN